MHYTVLKTLSHVLVDSGAEDNFIDANIMTQSNIPTCEEVLAINGTKLFLVMHRTNPLSLTLSGNQETIQPHVIPSPLLPVVLALVLKCIIPTMTGRLHLL